MRMNFHLLSSIGSTLAIALRLTASATSIVLLSMLGACSDPRVDGLALGEERSTSNEAQITEKMVTAIKEISKQRHANEYMKRFNQVKTIACVEARFTVNEGLPTKFREGIFSQTRNYPAKLRFANATKFDDREKDFRGLSISVFNDELPAWPKPLFGVSGRQDFLLNSYPVLFARDGSDFLEFIEATRDDAMWKYFVRPSHFYSLFTALRGRDEITNPLAIQYWSTVPFRHGVSTNNAVKYSVAPCTENINQETKPDSADFLATAMAEQFAAGPVCMDFMVQQQTDPQKMPIEDASVRWDEDASPFVKVATITVKQQTASITQNQQECEDYSFNPWQALPAHQPLGDINRLRKAVYAELATFRNAHNEQQEFK